MTSRVLLTGLSGTGKSTLIVRLARLGYKAVDLDSHVWSEFVDVPFDGDPTSGDSPVEPDRDWVWREDRVRDLLSTQEPGVTFVAGCASNMSKFLNAFDCVILLSASAANTVERLRARHNNAYGQNPQELTRVLAQRDVIEPRLRRIADYEIDTGASIDEILQRVLDIVRR